MPRKKSKKEAYNFEPCLLISMPQMMDPNFNQTVSILSEFNDKGAVALVLNRPLEVSLYDILSPDFRKQFDLDPLVSQILHKSRVFWGGPVDVQQGLILHTSKEFEEDSVAVQDKIFITGSINVLKELVKRKAYGHPESFFRFLLGYAGWDSNQLEKEMSESCWMTSDLQLSVLDVEPENLWKQSVKNLGIDVSQLASVPQHDFH